MPGNLFESIFLSEKTRGAELITSATSDDIWYAKTMACFVSFWADVLSSITQYMQHWLQKHPFLQKGGFLNPLLLLGKQKPCVSSLGATSSWFRSEALLFIILDNFERKHKSSKLGQILKPWKIVPSGLNFMTTILLWLRLQYQTKFTNLASISASQSSNNFTTFMWPPSTAWKSAVWPFRSLRLIFAPCCKRIKKLSYSMGSFHLQFM